MIDRQYYGLSDGREVKKLKITKTYPVHAKVIVKMIQTHIWVFR